MRYYSAPQVIYLGDLGSLTGLSSHPTEEDTFVTSSGIVGHGEGPVSEIFCQTNSNRQVCVRN